MNNKCKKRWKKAKKFIKKINKLIDQGYLIFDDYGEKIDRRFIITKNQISLKTHEWVEEVFFVYNTELDNGCHESHKEWTQRFMEWRVVRPECYKTLEERIEDGDFL